MAPLSSLFRRHRVQPAPERYQDLKSTPASGRPSTDTEAHPEKGSIDPVDVKRATRTRRNALTFAAFCFFVSLIFLILVEIGNTYARPALNDIYFLKLDVSNIIPQSVPDATLINSIARTLGLHDFYTVGMWNYCEGYNTEGVTNCSSPQALYWFNPISILLNELLSGATLSLPAEIVTALHLVKTASHWMFVLFLTGFCLVALSIPLMFLPLYTRWLSLPVTIFTFLAALFTTVATVLGTVIFVIFRNTVKNNGVGINLEASIGGRMFAFMWIASAFAILGWLLNFSMCCCCASRRDVKTGRKTGRKQPRSDSRLPSFVKGVRRRR